LLSPPPAAVEVVVQIQAAGDVSDFVDPGVQAKILQVIADAAGLSPVGAVLNVTSASVIISAVFPVDDAATAAAASSSISTAMSSPVAASLLFTSAGVAVSVESTPTISVVAVISPSPPPLPPPPSAPSPQLPTSGEEFPIIIVAAAAGGGGAILIGLGLVTLYWYLRRKRQRARDAQAAENKAEAEKMTPELELGIQTIAPSASPRKDAPPSERTMARAALQVQKVARGKEERKSFDERKTQAAPNLTQNATLSTLTTEELATPSARKRKTEELAAERKRKAEEKRKREAEERRRRAEEAEQLRLKLELQGKNRIVEEMRLYNEAVAATERRALELASAIVIETEVRRFLAKKRRHHTHKYRVLKRPDHIDVAIMHGRGVAKLTELNQAKRRMEEFIRANAAKVAAKQAGNKYTPSSPALDPTLDLDKDAAQAEDKDAAQAEVRDKDAAQAEVRADAGSSLDVEVMPTDAPVGKELTA